MSADRTEKLTVTRTNSATLVKLVITEDGVTVNYTVKTYESQVAAGIRSARAGAERMLSQSKDA